MRRLAFALAFAVAASGAAAQSRSQQQTHAANHLAQVMAIELECPEYQASALNVSLLMARYDLEIGTEPLASRMTRLVAEHRAGLQAAGRKVGCIVGWGLYGPGGQNVPNLLRKK